MFTFETTFTYDGNIYNVFKDSSTLGFMSVSFVNPSVDEYYALIIDQKGDMYKSETINKKDYIPYVYDDGTIENINTYISNNLSKKYMPCNYDIVKTSVVKLLSIANYTFTYKIYDNTSYGIDYGGMMIGFVLSVPVKKIDITCNINVRKMVEFGKITTKLENALSDLDDIIPENIATLLYDIKYFFDENKINNSISL